jgi:hypothetical protein
VTTLPAKPGSFWLGPKAPALTGASRTTLTAPRDIHVRRLDPSPRCEPCRPSKEGAASRPVVLPSRGEILNAISTAEHPKEPKLPGTRDMSYPRAFLVEPPEPTVGVKVLRSLYHGSLTRLLTTTSLDAEGTRCDRSPTRSRGYLDAHPPSPPAFKPESPVEVFYGDGDCTF